jgi:hypothetical protein
MILRYRRSAEAGVRSYRYRDSTTVVQYTRIWLSCRRASNCIVRLGNTACGDGAGYTVKIRMPSVPTAKVTMSGASSLFHAHVVLVFYQCFFLSHAGLSSFPRSCTPFTASLIIPHGALAGRLESPDRMILVLG